MRASGSWRTTDTSRLISIPSMRGGCWRSWTKPCREDPGGAVRAPPLPGPPLRADQGQELRVGEVLCRHEGTCPEKPVGVLTGGDAYGRDTRGNGGGDARDRVFEGESFLGRDVRLPKGGPVGGWIWLHSLDLIGEHDGVEVVSKLQGEQDRLDVLFRGVGYERDLHSPFSSSLYKLNETGQGF